MAKSVSSLPREPSLEKSGEDRADSLHSSEHLETISESNPFLPQATHRDPFLGPKFVDESAVATTLRLKLAADSTVAEDFHWFLAVKSHKISDYDKVRAYKTAVKIRDMWKDQMIEIEVFSLLIFQAID